MEHNPNLPSQRENVLIAGKYPAESVAISLLESTATHSAELLELIDAEWQRQLEKAAEGDYSVWDSECYALHSAHTTSGGVELGIEPVRFKYASCSAQLIKRGEFGSENASRMMYSSLIVKTEDEKLVFGLGAKQRYIGELKFVGGVYSKQENTVNDGNTLFQSARNELHEELGVSSDHIETMTLDRIYTTPLGYRDLCFSVQLNCSSEYVRKLFSERPDDELSDILILSPKEARKQVSELQDRRSEKAELL